MIPRCSIALAALVGGCSVEARPPTAAPTSAARPAPPRTMVPFGEVATADPAVAEDSRDTIRCLPDAIVAGARIVLLGAYEGGRPTSFVFDGENHAVGSITVGAEAAGPPLVVVLAAYDPTIWDLRGVPPGRLRAVVVHGVSAQAVAGVARETPLRFATGNGSSGCGEPFFAYEQGPELQRLEADVERTMGRRPDIFRGGYDPSYLHLDHDDVGPSPVRALRTAELRASAPVSRTALPPMEQGLAALAAAHAIRPATARDVEALRASLPPESDAARLATVAAGEYRDAWVVRRPITVPRGMYGAHSATFLVERGVPDPVDAGSHNTYIRLDTGGCAGSGCRRLDPPPVVPVSVRN